jgi:hypothetical protein
MKVHPVDVAHIHAVWPSVEGFIASALEYSCGDYTVESVKTLVSAGQLLLVAVTDETKIAGVFVVQMFNRPHDRVAFVVAVGGKHIASKDTFMNLKQLLTSFGATCLEGAARESVARLWSRYGFKEKYRIVGVKL